MPDSTTTSISSSTTSQQILAADPTRISVTIVATDANRFYWLYGSAAATTSVGGYTDYLDFDDDLVITGPEAELAIQGIWSADGSGGISVTTVTTAQLAGAGSSSILEIIQNDVSPEIGIAVPDAVFSSTDQTQIELQRITNKALKQIRRAYRWQKLAQEAVYSGDDATEDFDLPEDFDWMPDDQQVWSSAWQQPLLKIESQNDWLGLDVRNFNTGVNRWIIYGGQIHIKDAIATGETGRHFYQSTAAVQPASGVAKSLFTLDTDTFRIDDELLALCIIYLWKQSKGIPYAQAMADYETLKDKLITRDKGATILAQGRSRMPRGVTLAFPGSVPGGVP